MIRKILWLIDGLFLLGLLFLARYGMIYLTGNSMSPTVNDGDLMIIKTVFRKSEIKPGVIIAFGIKGKRIFHRVVSVDGNVLRTKGDANHSKDNWQISKSDIMGIYIFKIPRLGKICRYLQNLQKSAQKADFFIKLRNIFYFLSH